MHHVIVGNGVAGIEAAITLRNRDADAKITLISAEHDHFYSRTALMYILCGQLSLRDTEPYDRELYNRMRFERVSKRVAAVEPAAHRLRFEDGSALDYDRLLLAVGSRGRPAPWKGADQGPGVHYFVTLQDLAGLDAAAKKGDHVVVIGGGLIGVEVAETLHLRGLHVHFLVREPWYFPVALDEREGAVVAEHIRAHGVDVRLDTNVDEILRDASGAVRGVRVGAEEIPARFVVSAIGVVPNTAFLRDALPLSNGGAIETTDNLSVVGHPHVFSAGDCANVTWFDGSRRPEQLWYTARDQGRAAARAMLGDTVAYRRGTWYNSAKFFDVEYTTAGWIPFPAVPAGDANGYSTWYQQTPGACVTQRIVCKGPERRVVGFNALGTRWNHEVFLRWIHERRPLDYVLKHMEEARFDEEFMPAFRALPTATVTEGA